MNRLSIKVKIYFKVGEQLNPDKDMVNAFEFEFDKKFLIPIKGKFQSKWILNPEELPSKIKEIILMRKEMVDVCCEQFKEIILMHLSKDDDIKLGVDYVL